MDSLFDINFDPTAAVVKSDLERSIDDVTAQIVRTIAEDAPDEMRGLMSEGGVSVKGEAPRIRSGNLSRSLKGHVVSPTEAELEFIGYAEYLDPVFGGKLDFPFVDQGIERTLAKDLSEFR